MLGLARTGLVALADRKSAGGAEQLTALQEAPMVGGWLLRMVKRKR